MSEQDDKNLDDAVAKANDPWANLRSAPLSEEAVEPYDPGPTLAQRLAAGKPGAEVIKEASKAPIDPETGLPVKRGRGRPPGRKNNATLIRESQGEVKRGTPSRMVVPPPKPVKPDDGLTPEQRRERKLARAEKLGEGVADTINDNLMLLLTTMGMPQELLYMPGMAPSTVKADPKYTALGKSLAVSPMQAQVVGRFLAEMEETDIGGKLGSTVSEGKGPLIIYGILSLAAGVQWAKGLNDAYKQMEPLLKAYQASKNVQAQSQPADDSAATTGGS